MLLGEIRTLLNNAHDSVFPIASQIQVDSVHPQEKK